MNFVPQYKRNLAYGLDSLLWPKNLLKVCKYIIKTFNITKDIFSYCKKRILGLGNIYLWINSWKNPIGMLLFLLIYLKWLELYD